jgi:hypothetical protein
MPEVVRPSVRVRDGFSPLGLVSGGSLGETAPMDPHAPADEPAPRDRVEEIPMKGPAWRVILRCLVTFAFGVLLVLLAIKFGQELWKVVER